MCKRTYLWLLLAPLAVAFLMTIIANSTWRHDIPQSLEPHEWANFTRHVQVALHEKYNTHNIVIFLLVVHAMQTLFCFPLMHVTKIMYGYLLGVFTGCALATAWEMALVTACVLACTRLESAPAASDAALAPPLRMLLDYTLQLRESGRFYVFVMCVQLASIPLLTAATLLLYNVMTHTEFLVSHLVVTFLMSFKDAWLGSFVATSDAETLHVGVVVALFMVSTLLPTVATVVVLGKVSQVALQIVKNPEKPSKHSGGIENDTLLQTCVE